MPATIQDFDAYLNRTGKYGRVQRPKLLYAVQHFSVYCDGGFLAFDSPCFADKLGPVFPDLGKNRKGNPANLDARQKWLCDAVLKEIGHLSGKALADRSHKLYPEWQLARNRGNKRIYYRDIRQNLTPFLAF